MIETNHKPTLKKEKEKTYNHSGNRNNSQWENSANSLEPKIKEKNPKFFYDGRHGNLNLGKSENGKKLIKKFNYHGEDEEKREKG